MIHTSHCGTYIERIPDAEEELFSQLQNTEDQRVDFQQNDHDKQQLKQEHDTVRSANDSANIAAQTSLRNVCLKYMCERMCNCGKFLPHKPG